jgi:dTDP-4-amino-4,6-dideoxygalactose transaminase
LANIPEARKAVNAHRANAKYMTEKLSNIEFVQIQEFDNNSSYWLFPLVLKKGYSRNDFIRYLQDNNIESSPVHYRNDLYDATRQFSEGLLPGLEHFSEHQINIPCGWWLSNEELLYIVNTIKSYKYSKS